jgi:Cu(I)/Ag(I) efflux system membrane fusion protein
LKNNTGEFKPGMFVEGNVLVGNSKKEERFAIPSTAVLWTGERSLVYVKTKANQSVFEMREITIGDNFDDQIEVLEGLKNGEEIVINGTFTVDAAAQLRGKQSMMNTVEPEVTDTLSLKRIKVPLAFQEQLKDVFNLYLKLKDALVKDDLKTAKQSSKDLVENLKKVDMELISDKNTHMKWMVLEKGITAEANHIFKSETIEQQRTYFKQLSLFVTNAIQIFGVNQTVYRQFCPMVNDNQGAYWLSLTKEIYNPYFGDAMLTCGSTKQIIE